MPTYMFQVLHLVLHSDDPKLSIPQPGHTPILFS